ncbi:MAG: hypothetical protein Hals2KO_26970 [Halioglobus sp.]
MMRIRQPALPLLFALALVGACSGESRSLDVPPAQAGLQQPENLSWWSRVAIDAYIRFSSWRKERSGYIVMFARDGVPIYSNAAGYKDIASATPMTVDTHVRIASMTKPITAAVAMTLVEEGRLGLDDPVANYLPEFAQVKVATSHSRDADGEFPTRAPQQPMTIRHLLMFSSGVGPGMPALGEAPGESAELLQHWRDNSI